MPSTRGKSWRRANPRDVLARLIAEHPKGGKRKLKEQFLTVIRGKDGRAALDSVAEICRRDSRLESRDRR